MTASMWQIRNKAAHAVFALGERTADKGRKDAHQPAKPGWVPNAQDPDYGYILPSKLREALAFYDIAISIADEDDPNRAGTVYTKGLLLEDLGDFTEAEAVFASLEGTVYQDSGRRGAQRCKARREGKYGFRAKVKERLAMIASIVRGNPGEAFAAALQRAEEARQTHRQTEYDHQKGKIDSPAADESTESDADEEAAADVALRFVNLLLDQNYAAAHELLHPDLSALKPEELAENFEALFPEEEFPETANVFSVLRDWPHKRREDVGSFYVSIDSMNGEAVSVIVTKRGGSMKIREVEWGRP